MGSRSAGSYSLTCQFADNAPPAPTAVGCEDRYAMTALRNIPVACFTDAASFAIRGERASEVAAREALLDTGFGANRQTRTCQRLRDGQTPAEGLAFSAVRRGL